MKQARTRGGGAELAAELCQIAAVAEIAAYLDDRLCVPRDMGAPTAAKIRELHLDLQLRGEVDCSHEADSVTSPVRVNKF